VIAASSNPDQQPLIVRLLVQAATSLHRCRTAGQVSAIVLLVSAFVDPSPAWKTATFLPSPGRARWTDDLVERWEACEFFVLACTDMHRRSARPDQEHGEGHNQGAGHRAGVAPTAQQREQVQRRLASLFLCAGSDSLPASAERPRPHYGIGDRVTSERIRCGTRPSVPPTAGLLHVGRRDRTGRSRPTVEALALPPPPSSSASSPSTASAL
jgi:hypothetical protein